MIVSTHRGEDSSSTDVKEFITVQSCTFGEHPLKEMRKTKQNNNLIVFMSDPH